VEVVVDTNIIISALLRNGSARKILLLAPFKFYTVPYAKREIERHKTELIKKAGIGEDIFQYLLNIIFEKIEIVTPDVINPYKEKAAEIMKDIDPSDTPFIALALNLNCHIVSEDKHLKKQTVVKTFTIKEILDII
jgi:predicted nucleic acid-binding protein